MVKDNIKLYQKEYYQKTKERRNMLYREMTHEQREELSRKKKEYYLKKKEKLAQEKEKQWAS